MTAYGPWHPEWQDDDDTVYHDIAAIESALADLKEIRSVLEDIYSHATTMASYLIDAADILEAAGADRSRIDGIVDATCGVLDGVAIATRGLDRWSENPDQSPQDCPQRDA